MSRSRRGGCRWLTPALGGWIAATGLSTLATGISWFAMVWAASAAGAAWASAVAAAYSVPLVALLLVGGIVGDRWGLRRTILITTAATLTVLAVTAVITGGPANPTVLTAAAFVLGAVSAIGTPASGGIVRLFVVDDDLTPALAAMTTLLQIVRIGGPGLGGIATALLGLQGSLTIAAGGLLVAIAVMAAITPPRRYAPAPPAGIWAQLGDGFRTVLATPTTRGLVASLVLMAGAILPLVTVVVPLIGRERAWTPHATGLLESSWIIGSLAVGVAVSALPTARRPRVLLIAGPAIAGAGILAVTFNAAWPLALIGMAVCGAGMRVYTSVAAPILMTSAPTHRIARVQAVLAFGQQAVVLAITPALGLVTQSAGVTAALCITAALAILAATVTVLVRQPTHDGAGLGQTATAARGSRTV